MCNLFYRHNNIHEKILSSYWLRAVHFFSKYSAKKIKHKLFSLFKQSKKTSQKLKIQLKALLFGIKGVLKNKFLREIQNIPPEHLNILLERFYVIIFFHVYLTA